MFGLIAIVVTTSQVFPLVLRVNLRDEADKLWQLDGRRRRRLRSATTGRRPSWSAACIDVDGAQSAAAWRELIGPLQRRAGMRARRCAPASALAITPADASEAGDQVLVVGQRRAMVAIGAA